ncbi:hypothetical protein [Haloarcula sp. CBA1127]|uniref:hypothetical protein n=1 Tax=Haloarcula sp. CBA1127 TaxID=1765055 RepID=UPI000A8A3E1C|nr:hypothetical protein [Haloarcula sp. CBA1127]
MKEADRPILTVLYRSTYPQRASSIRWILKEYFDISVPESTYYRRLKHLKYAQLIEKQEQYYSITDLGERLLDEDLTDDEVAKVTQRLQEGPPDDDS